VPALDAMQCILPSLLCTAVQGSCNQVSMYFSDVSSKTRGVTPNTSCPEAPCSSLAFCCFSRSSYLRACRSFFCALSNAAYFFLTSITIRPMDPSLRGMGPLRNEVGKIIFVVVFVLRRQRIREVGRLTFLNLTH
jgi:hypothetical protein